MRRSRVHVVTATPCALSGRGAQRVRRLMCVVIAPVLVSACAMSPAMRFYTLTRIAPETRLSVPPDTVPVQLGRVSVPGELDRLQLVRRIDATRLQIADQDRWAAPLDEMIRRVLSADLVARLPAGLVVDPNESPAGQRHRALSVDIQELYADAGCAVTLRATWVLTPPQGRAAKEGNRDGARFPAELAAQGATQVNEEALVPAGGACSGPDAVPGAISRALALLSDRIAARIANPASAARQP